MTNKSSRFEAISIGLAMFSMFFGAGNVIFPLALGQIAGDQNIYAMMGLILTAAVMPIAGVVAMILYDGDYNAFFGRLGRIPGFIVAVTIISLLGPLGSTPRCIALAYTTMTSSLVEMSPVLFSALSCSLILLLAINKNRVLSILGVVLTPFLLTALLLIIFLGLFYSPDIQAVDQQPLSMFFHGLKEGYNTMDLLAAFFFSSTILHILKSRVHRGEIKQQNYLPIAYQASMIGAVLLGAIYIGFSYLAAFHGNAFFNIGKDELLTAITLKIAGPYGGVLVCVTIILACLTTAIALISAFADFVQKEVFNENISYELTLFGSLLVTFCISTFEFTGISAFLGPILEVCYPGLIVLTLLNIAHRLWGIEPVKVPVFGAFILSAIAYWFQQT